jgi:hypothetical protein
VLGEDTKVVQTSAYLEDHLELCKFVYFPVTSRMGKNLEIFRKNAMSEKDRMPAVFASWSSLASSLRT